MKKTYLLFFLMVSLPSVTAEICDIAFDMGITEGETVPTLLPYHNERIAVYDMDDNEEGHIITQNGKIISTSCQIIDNPTYKVYVDGEKTMQELYDVTDRLKLFNTFLSEKRIIVDGQTFGRDVKMTFTRGALKVASWFR